MIRASTAVAFLLARVGLLLCAFTVACVPTDPTTGGGGCASTIVDPLAAITVAEAHLEDLELWQAGVLAGRTEGRATLVVVDVDGNELEFDAMLQGSHAGLVMDASVNAAFDGEYPLLLPANAPVTVRQLLGSYDGAHVGIDLIAGFHWRELQNGSQVRLNVTTLSFGLGFVPMTWEVIGIQLFDDPVDFVADPAPCGLFGCVPPDDDCVGGDDDCDVGCGDPDCSCEDEGDCEAQAELGEVCEWFSAGGLGTCASGVCVRRTERDDLGICRASCANDPFACADIGDGTTTCQDATVLPSLDIEGAVCLPRFGADAPCSAAFDVDACDEGLECRPTGANVEDLRCKETCGKGDVCSDALEQCVPVGTLSGRGPSTCGVTVPPLPALLAERARIAGGITGDITSDALDERFVCNEREERRYCDQAMFDDVRDAGSSLCLTFSPFNGAGFCFPLCATPTIDRDGNGSIDDDEKGATFDCGEGLTCTPSLAVATGVYDAPPTFPNGTVPRSCDPSLCPEGAPCAACGVGDATCSSALGEPLCLAPFSSCE